MTDNQMILENIYEEVMEELVDVGTLPMYTAQEIHSEVMNRFYGRHEGCLTGSSPVLPIATH